MIKPQPLSLGGTIGIVAPASPPKDPDDIDRGIEALKELGFALKIGRSVRKRRGYLAGHDLDRAADVNNMFKDKSVDAIVCLRGGYGSPRILDLIDYKTIKKFPKIFCGFSDITALHLAIQAKTGLCTFHGPTVLSGFAKESTSAYTTTSFLKAVCDSKSIGNIEKGFPRKKYEKVRSLAPGFAKGRMIGGNLSLITSLIGTKYLPPLSGSILFLEDINEPTYKIDRMITQLLHSRVLLGVKGIALGIWSGCGESNNKSGGGNTALTDMFIDRLSSLNVPVLYGLPFGHIDDYATLPLGCRAELNSANKTLTILEAGVKF